MKLGIDFGTTRTVVTAALHKRYPIVNFDVEGTFVDYIPGLAAVREGRLLFGWDAARALRGAPEESPVGGAVRSIKRRISRAAPDDPIVELELGDRHPTALELATGFLAHVRHMLVEHSNLELEPKSDALEVAVAVPANASTRQRYMTLEAFTGAGFSVLSLINEPTAAAIEFAFRKLAKLGPRSPKRYVVVYDLGGGTFDTSAVSLEGRRFELLHSEGMAKLGGDDFDRALLDLACERAGQSADKLAPHLRTLALERCREIKETLNVNSRKLLVDLGEELGDIEAAVFEVRAYYDKCQALVDRTLATVRKLFALLPDYGIDPDNARELGGLYLVGGGAAFVPVARALRQHYKRKIQLAPHPHAATALGLAIQIDPASGVFVREATTRHFGVWREAEAGQRKVFDCILSKNQVPEGEDSVVVRRSYQPTHTIGALRFLECSALDAAGQPAGEVTPWTRILFPYAPQLAERSDLAEVEVTRDADAGAHITESYEYARDGTMTVEIENLTHGYRRRFTLGAFR